MGLPGGHRIPTLAQVVELLDAPGRGVYVEIKDPRPEIVPALAPLLRRRQGQWTISSFHHAQLDRSRHHLPGLSMQALYDRTPVRWARPSQADEIGISNRMATPGLLAEINRAHGGPVLVYTVNSIDRERQLAGWGVSGVYTDTW